MAICGRAIRVRSRDIFAYRRDGLIHSVNLGNFILKLFFFDHLEGERLGLMEKEKFPKDG